MVRLLLTRGPKMMTEIDRAQPPLFLHMIWLGSRLREEELQSTRTLLMAAKSQQLHINFFVDNGSIKPVKRFLHGLQDTHVMQQYGLDFGYDFIQHSQIRIINIDEELFEYLDLFLAIPSISDAVKTRFPTLTLEEIREFIAYIVELECTGSARNLTSASDLLRAIAVLTEGGYYVDNDVSLNRIQYGVNGRFTFPEKLMMNELNNDIVAAPQGNPLYLEFLLRALAMYAQYLASSEDKNTIGWQ